MKHSFFLALAALPLLGTTALPQNPPSGMLWSTYLGGSDAECDSGICLRVADNGDVVVAGSTRSTTNFPTQGAYQPSHGGNGPIFGDGFFTRIRADGTGLVWSSFLGGTDDDKIHDIVVEPSGLITVCGGTQSPTFDGMTTVGGADAFVARFFWNGQSMTRVWSMLLGTSGDESASGLAIHPNGSIVVVGATNSTSFPGVSGRYQSQLAGGYDFFVAVLDAAGNLQHATYLGGSGQEHSFPGLAFAVGARVVLDAAGNPILVGNSSSVNFPGMSPGALQQTYGGGDNDRVLARFDLALRNLTYSTYLGGTGRDPFTELVLGPGDRVTIVGWSDSPNFPVTDGSTYHGSGSCLQPYWQGDATVTTVDLNVPGQPGLWWSTLLGTAQCDVATGVAVDRCGVVTVAGGTTSSVFPVTPGAYQTRYGGGPIDGIVVRYDPPSNGRARLAYATYLGGRDFDAPWGPVGLDGLGNAVVGGMTSSTNFPTSPGCFQPVFAGGGSDGFVTRLTLLPIGGQGVARYGDATRACGQDIWQDVDALPAAGNTFAVRVHGAAPTTPVVMFVGLPGSVSWQFQNLDVWLNQFPLVGLTAWTDGQGCASIPLVVPTPMPLGPIASQWVFLCPGTGILASSEGLIWW